MEGDLDSDQDTLVSDGEDKDVAKRYHHHHQNQRHRPSFTIGGSDSDSTSTATSTSVDNVERWRRGISDHHQPSSSTSRLKSIPSGSDNLSGNSGGSGGGGTLRQGKPGYMGGYDGGGSGGSRSSSGLEVSYKEIRLFATDGNDNDRNNGGGYPSTTFTRRQCLTFAVFGFVELFSAMVISLQAPFYPLEAEKKGASATEFGLVFGVFELAVFIISPIYGSKIHKIGPKLVFNLGIFVTSFSAIAFGFLDKIDDRTLFVGLSITIRVIEALGEAAFITASFVIIAAEFPQSVATTFAAMETFYGLGLIIGPLVGGLLYQIGGYTFPFVSVGGLLLLAALFTTFAMPSTKRREDNTLSRRMSSEEPGSSGGFKMFSLLTVPPIALAAFSIFSASASISYLNATMEPFIRRNNLSPSPLATGAIFIVNGGVYAITSPIWGWICDRITNHLRFVSIIGCLLIFVGFGLIGPIPYVPLEPSLWGVIVGQAIQGVGLGAVLVSAFIQSLREAVKTGLPDNVQTYSLVSGVWTSMFALGAFVGPTVAGVLFDIVGFRQGTLFILGLQLSVVVLVLSAMCCLSSSNEEENEETSPLFARNSPSPQNRRQEQSPTPGTSSRSPSPAKKYNNKNGSGIYGTV